MYARVIPIQCRSGLLTDFLSVYRSAVMPPLVQEPGFNGTLVLSDPEIHTGFIVTLVELSDCVSSLRTEKPEGGCRHVVAVSDCPPPA